MATDPTGVPEPTGMVPAEALAALRDALQRHLTTTSADGDLHWALHRFSREARANGLRAEHALVLLHGLWDSMSEVRQAGGWLERQSLLRGLVTLCLDQYFADE
jgi:hypothetical protein